MKKQCALTKNRILMTNLQKGYFPAIFLPHKFLTKKHVNVSNFLDTPRLFFLFRMLLQTRNLMKETDPIEIASKKVPPGRPD